MPVPWIRHLLLKPHFDHESLKRKHSYGLRYLVVLLFQVHLVEIPDCQATGTNARVLFSGPRLRLRGVAVESPAEPPSPARVVGRLVLR